MSAYYYIVFPVAYILSGIGWGFLRWKRFVDNEVDFYEKERQRFLNHHRIRGADIPAHLVFEWRHYVQNSSRLREIPPKSTDYQGQIAFDVLLWWASMICVILEQTISAVMKIIMAEYNKITISKIANIKRDMKG